MWVADGVFIQYSTPPLHIFTNQSIVKATILFLQCWSVQEDVRDKLIQEIGSKLVILPVV